MNISVPHANSGYRCGHYRGAARAVGDPARKRNLRAADWLYRSRVASVLWLVARVWLGYGWLNAGYQKIWDAESAGFWSSGAGVKGFATAGVAGSKAGTGGASYGWFATFLHGFVIPNSTGIAKLVAVSELTIGALLILGLFTGAVAFAGLALNVIYMFSGSSGVNPAYAIVAVFLVLAWRNAGYLGLDSFALPKTRQLLHRRPRTARPVPAPRPAAPVTSRTAEVLPGSPVTSQDPVLVPAARGSENGRVPASGSSTAPPA
jgi:thiosulfate dehydrogenase (quinone) large subunit